MTEAETKLWAKLRDRQVEGLKFRRQHALGPYIANFVCLEKRLVIEVDGGQHALDKNIATDARRTVQLAADGYQVLRFWNSEVLANLAGVIDVIATELRRLPSTPRSNHQTTPPPNRA